MTGKHLLGGAVAMVRAARGRNWLKATGVFYGFDSWESVPLYQNLAMTDNVFSSSKLPILTLKKCSLNIVTSAVKFRNR